MRLHQHSAAGWLVWDYAGRVAALVILAAIPAARAIAYRREKRRISLLEIGVWIAGSVLLDRLGQWPLRLMNATFPATIVGKYPHPIGWLNVFDLVVGLILIAASEEIIFRRLLRNTARPYLGDGAFAVLISSLMFGAPSLVVRGREHPSRHNIRHPFHGDVSAVRRPLAGRARALPR
ncbi:membrane protease YdiL (CAAX protease family) [Bradyrhizobium ottawaense]